jgi:hypothetical protein
MDIGGAFHSSVSPAAEGVLALYVPVPVDCVVPCDVSDAVAISFISDQDVPFQNSVFVVTPGVGPPPKTITEVYSLPPPVKNALPVFKLLPSVQLVPFHCSLCVGLVDGTPL